ncbi:MAG: ferritin-like domain-containing protein, partial [Pirellulales bacterium]
MARLEDEGRNTLNDLISACHDAESGFRTLAENAPTKETKALFQHYAEQHHRFAAGLQEEVRHLGGESSEGGTVRGAMHRGWVNVKSAVAGPDEAYLLSDCRRDEAVLLEKYQEALTKPLSTQALQLVGRQCAEIQRAYERIGKLEKAETQPRSP